jgi:hypothetical protein
VLPDLVLLDVMMPSMSGYEVAARLRQSYPSSLLPIIMVSAGCSFSIELMVAFCCSTVFLVALCCICLVPESVRSCCIMSLLSGALIYHHTLSCG